MTRIVKVYCDVCKKLLTEWEIENLPPDIPDLCEKHLKDYMSKYGRPSTYTLTINPKIKTWLK